MLRETLDLLVKGAQFVEAGDRSLKLGPIAVSDLVQKRLDRRAEIELRILQELRRLVDRLEHNRLRLLLSNEPQFLRERPKCGTDPINVSIEARLADPLAKCRCGLLFRLGGESPLEGVREQDFLVLSQLVGLVDLKFVLLEGQDELR